MDSIALISCAMKSKLAAVARDLQLIALAVGTASSAASRHRQKAADAAFALSVAALSARIAARISSNST